MSHTRPNRNMFQLVPAHAESVDFAGSVRAYFTGPVQNLQGINWLTALPYRCCSECLVDHDVTAILCVFVYAMQVSIVKKRVAVPSKADVAAVIKTALRTAQAEDDPVAEVRGQTHSHTHIHACANGWVTDPIGVTCHTPPTLHFPGQANTRIISGPGLPAWIHTITFK